MIVAFAAGGPADVFGRVLASRMRDSLKQPVIIENVSGADGTIGTGRAARAKPDGYTIDLGLKTTHVMVGAVYSLPYDVLNDFEPVSPVVTTPFFLFARKMMPATDLTEFVAWLRANPNKASAGITAVNSHLLTEIFRKQTGTQFALVPYRGTNPAMQDLVAGQIDFCFNPPDSLPLIRAGSIKAYAVTSDMRFAPAPELPTFGEMGLPALSQSEWWGLFAPKRTPKDVIGKLNAAVVEALADPAVQTRLADIGAEIFPRHQQTPEALGALLKADAAKLWPIIKEFGIRAG